MSPRNVFKECVQGMASVLNIRLKSLRSLAFKFFGKRAMVDDFHKEFMWSDMDD